MTHSVGILAWDGPPPQTVAGARAAPPRPGVVAPDTVRAGVAFPVTVTTVGLTVCWRAAGADVTAQPALATVTPIDYTPEDRSAACGDALVELARTTPLVFHVPGEAVLRVHGRRVAGAAVQGGEPVVLEKRIRVL